MNSKEPHLGLAKSIAFLEQMPIRIGEINPMGGGSFLVKFKYYSDKKKTWVSQMAPYVVGSQDEKLTLDEYGKLIIYIIALSASIEDCMPLENYDE